MRHGGVAITGVSTRAFAESAWRAGFRCETVDGFGDLDQKARIRNVSFHRDLGRRYSAHAAAAVSRRLSARAAAYVGNFENHPDAVRRLAEGRLLLGNPPDVLVRARDPFLLAEAVAAAGARMPVTLRPRDAWRADPDRRWLRKPVRGGGGSGVRPWRPGERLGAHEIAQEHLDGVAASIVFLADGNRAALLGLSRQLINTPHFRYAGSLYPLCPPSIESRAGPLARTSLEGRAAAVAAAVTAAFRLQGVNGLDLVLRDGEWFVLELNPRYPASAELIERATGLSIFEAHVDACLGRIRVASSGQPPSVWGKAILYARHDVVTGDTCTLLENDAFRDIPFPYERIRRGQPICTLFANGANHSTCLTQLTAATQVVERLLGPTHPT